MEEGIAGRKLEARCATAGTPCCAVMVCCLLVPPVQSVQLFNQRIRLASARVACVECPALRQATTWPCALGPVWYIADTSEEGGNRWCTGHESRGTHECSPGEHTPGTRTQAVPTIGLRLRARWVFRNITERGVIYTHAKWNASAAGRCLRTKCVRLLTRLSIGGGHVLLVMPVHDSRNAVCREPCSVETHGRGITCTCVKWNSMHLTRGAFQRRVCTCGRVVVAPVAPREGF